MRIGILDDQTVYIEDVKKRLDSYALNHNVHFDIDLFADYQIFLERFEKQPYDMVFLEVEMNNDTDFGFMVAEKIKQIKPNCILIFISANEKLYRNSFRADAFQFMSKPIDEEFFNSEITRAIKHYKSLNKVYIFPTKQGKKVFRANEIIYLETSYRTYKLATTKHSHYGNSRTIDKVKLELLESNFFKVQRSYIINLDYIVQFDSSTVTMCTGDVINISKNNIIKFREAFFRYIA